ncbi:MAG: helix-turn-helix domain-containing protein [Gaiellaceae bacterium]
MFEIGNSLREARLRQSLDFPRIEEGTKIRGKYIQALEAERFEVLPGDTYVKGFLRTYAEYLGLDGQLYVDEYNSRFASAEEPLNPSTPPTRPRHRVSESNFVVVALAAIVAVTVLVVVAFGFGDGTSSDPTVGVVGGSTSESTKTETTKPSDPAGEEKSKPTLARLLLRASEGDCWMVVKAGGPQGEVLYSGTLEEGQGQRFVRKRLWLQLGAPGALTVKLNGKAVRNLSGDGTFFLVTAKGVRRLATT